MNRRDFLITAPAGLSALATAGCKSLLSAGTDPDTRWVVTPAIGLDACFVLTIAAAQMEVLQANHHAARRDEFRRWLGPEGVEAAEHLMTLMKSQGKTVPGAGLALMASVGALETVDQVTQTFATPGVFETGFAGTNYYQGDGAIAQLEELRPLAAKAFSALGASAFVKNWQSDMAPALNRAAGELTDELRELDLISMHKKYLSREFDPTITLYVSKLSEPHGIRILGQRFITSPNYSSLIVRRNAAHELIHPLLEPAQPETTRIRNNLQHEPLLHLIARKSNPSFGYSSVRSLIEEGGTQALEAVINEMLGQARDQTAYWRKQDGGMHLFAAAMYALMHETGFTVKGGDTLAWLADQTDVGRLQGASLQALASSVVGEDAVAKWLTA